MPSQVDIFSFGVILLEVFAKSVTGAALLTVGDMEECEMYAWKVSVCLGFRVYSERFDAGRSTSLTQQPGSRSLCAAQSCSLCFPHTVAIAH